MRKKTKEYLLVGLGMFLACLLAFGVAGIKAAPTTMVGADVYGNHSDQTRERPYLILGCETIDFGPNLPAEFLDRHAAAVEALDAFRESGEFWLEFLGDRSKAFTHQADAIRDGIAAGYYEGDALIAALCDVSILESRIALYEGRILLVLHCEGTPDEALDAIACVSMPPHDEDDGTEFGIASSGGLGLRRR